MNLSGSFQENMKEGFTTEIECYLYEKNKYKNDNTQHIFVSKF